MKSLNDIVNDRIIGGYQEIDARDFLRYKALRKLLPHQFQELHNRNLKGENFDSMVDEMVVTDNQ